MNVQPRLMRLARARASTVAAALLLAALALLALLGPPLFGLDTVHQDMMARYLPPAWDEFGVAAHPLGTDQLGRDLLARIVHGLRVSLLIGMAAASLSALLGTAIGLVSGYVRGWPDVVLMRLADIQLAFPLLVLAIAVMGVIGGSVVALTLVLGLWGWALFARVVRAEAMAQMTRDYVEAARAVGSTGLRIMLRHVLPNTLSSVIVLWTFAVGQMIVIEGALSFVGLGVRPPQPSLGGIINDGRQVLELAWWVTVFPGLVLVALVLAINTLGDALRDHLDPYARTRR